MMLLGVLAFACTSQEMMADAQVVLDKVTIAEQRLDTLKSKPEIQSNEALKRDVEYVAAVLGFIKRICSKLDVNHEDIKGASGLLIETEKRISELSQTN